MNQKSIFVPTVLLLDEAGRKTTTKRWLEKRGYNVEQVDCVSDAIENTTDYTLGTRPSMILLNFGQAAEISAEKLRLLQDITDFEDVPLVALSDSPQKDGEMLTIENLEALQPLMNNLLAKTFAKAA